MRCSKCGAEIKPGAKFCGKCGMKVALTVPPASGHKICPGCGSANAASAKFCRTCGHSLRSDKIITGGGTIGTVAAKKIKNIENSILTGLGKGSGGDTGTDKRSSQAKIDRNVMSYIWPALGLDACLFIGILGISYSDYTLIGLIFLLLAFLIVRHLITYMQGVVDDLNKIAGPYDGQTTSNYALMMLVITPLTLGIGNLIWYHKISNRIHNELMRRGFIPNFGPDTFWLWNVFGVFIFDLGPFIYHHKLFDAMNILGHDYNTKGY